METVLALYLVGLIVVEVGMGRARAASHSLMKGLAAAAAGWLGAVGTAPQDALLSSICGLVATTGLAERVTLSGAFFLSLTASVCHRLFTVIDRAIGQAVSHHLPASLSDLQGIQGWLSQYWVPDYGGLFFVHALGGGAVLGALIAVGSRLGRYSRTGAPQALLAHSLPLTGIGILFLWLGCQGMAPGLWMSSSTSAFVAFLSSLVFTRIRFGKVDASFALTSFWTGLVAGLGTGSDQPIGAVLAGIIAGLLTIIGSLLLDRFFVDDPVGVVVAEGLAPAIGLLSQWAFGYRRVGAGLLPWLLAVSVGFAAARIACRILRALGILRPSPSDELTGLDQRLYGVTAYPDFEVREA
ncbi:MAG: hypothetical protein NZ959_04785 [Armatimonadetes bacterium]|nr:hypothetical protein [Armatimonadota bacterium]MDW8120889.1 hypothetical protein [Armatimonadota bacterium]